MGKSFIRRFLFRWFVCSLGLWIAAALLRGGIDYEGRLEFLLIAGLLLAVINTFVKPIVIFLSLPAILLTLGLFLIVVNALMILLVSSLYEPFKVSGFGTALLTGVIIGLVNYLVSAIKEDKK